MNDSTVVLSPAQVAENKRKIIALFLNNVKGKVADVSAMTLEHDGKYGHWLEQQMGIRANGDNAPDLFGFEMKNDTLSRTTFGDWSADYRIFTKKKGGEITKEEFLQAFGQPNKDRDGRLAWSGKICPKIGDYNYGGQRLVVDDEGNIIAEYCYSKDTRQNKSTLVFPQYQRENVVLARWSAEYLRGRVEDKFNQNGWFKCLTDRKSKVYTEIVFGEPITFETWIEYVKTGDVIFDCGMYEGNDKPYANWRSSNTFWHKLITSRY